MQINKAPDLYNATTLECSKKITVLYSTSFSSAVRLLHKDLRDPIYAIYGFVRFADEIVDSFEGFDKAGLLSRFKKETYQAIDEMISLNPVLHSMQGVVHKYNIDPELIEAFFESMEMDLHNTNYENTDDFNKYIYGSAEVVGLMCLQIFVNGDRARYLELRDAARALGAAFQKVNFLRDLKDDTSRLNRSYFPECSFNSFDEATKMQIEKGIEEDFSIAYHGIKRLPLKARFGVFVAYKYYHSLFIKIKSLSPARVMQQRIRINDYSKALIVLKARMSHQFSIIRDRAAII